MNNGRKTDGMDTIKRTGGRPRTRWEDEIGYRIGQSERRRFGIGISGGIKGRLMPSNGSLAKIHVL